MLSPRHLLRTTHSLRLSTTTTPLRTFTTTPTYLVEAPTLTSPTNNTSTVLNPPPKPTPTPTPTPPRSSVPAGTILKGLNYYKNKTDPVAMEDHEYPDWLWSVLDAKVKSASEGQKVEVDPRLFSKSARARQKANKLLREQAKRNPTPAERPLPIYEQTIDLPTGSVAEAQGGRVELTRAMRVKRRRDIKEGNFLKSMT